MSGELSKEQCLELKELEATAKKTLERANALSDAAYLRATRQLHQYELAIGDVRVAEVVLRVATTRAKLARAALKRCEERLDEGLEESCETQEAEKEAAFEAHEIANTQVEELQEGADADKELYDSLLAQHVESLDNVDEARTAFAGVREALKEGHCFRFKE